MVTSCFVGVRWRGGTRMARSFGVTDTLLDAALLRKVMTDSFPLSDIRTILSFRIADEPGDADGKHNPDEWDYDMTKWASRLPEATTKSHGRIIPVIGGWGILVEEYNYIVDVEECVVYMLHNQRVMAEVPIQGRTEGEIDNIIALCDGRREGAAASASFWPTMDFFRYNGWPSSA